MSGTAIKWVGWGAAFVIASAFIFNLMLPQPIQRPFDAAEWVRLSKDQKGKSKRGKMAEDLIRNHLKKGIARDKILAMIGEPDSSPREGCAAYYLGWYKSLMDPESLVVCFAGDGLLTETYIWQH